MGIALPKSVRVGPLGLNVSRAGLGVSVGATGTRFAFDASGHPYAHLGRHGVYWRRRVPLPAPGTLQPPLGRPPPETHHRVAWSWILLGAVVLWLFTRKTLDWKLTVEVLSAALTPVIGMTTLYIAYQQYRVNERRLRHELYERRAAAFRGVLEHLYEVCRYAAVKREDLPKLIRATSEQRFLFDEHLCQYLDEIYKRSVDLWQAGEEVRNLLPGTPEKKDAVERQVNLVVWMRDQVAELHGRFAKYLRLS